MNNVSSNSISLQEMEEACPIPLLILALIEARQYRWQKSLQEKKDAGEDSILEWFRKNFRDWYREQWVKHLNGLQYYEGFSSEEFNITSSAKEDEALIKTMVQFLVDDGNKGENLGIILWAREFGADMNKVIKFLRKIKINSKRFIWDSDTLQFICMALQEADRYKWIESQKAGKDLGEKAIYDWFKQHWCTWKEKNVSNFIQKVS